MADAISNTSPLLYLHRIGALDWLGILFGEVWAPHAVIQELRDGGAAGHEVPVVPGPQWLRVMNPRHTPSEWLALDLGPGELAAMALGLEHPERIVLLDDALARRTAKAAGLQVWGTLRILLEAKTRGQIERVEPFVERLSRAGMWLSKDVRKQILALAGE